MAGAADGGGFPGYGAELFGRDDGAYGQLSNIGSGPWGSGPPDLTESPWQNPYVERLIGTLRRDCLDHVLIFGERHLRRVLTSYSVYYNETRTSGVGQRRRRWASRRAIRGRRSHTGSVRITSSLRADIIFGKDIGRTPGDKGVARFRLPGRFGTDRKIYTTGAISSPRRTGYVLGYAKGQPVGCPSARDRWP